MTAENVADDPISELAAGILSDVVGEAIAMLTLVTVESVSRVILSVAVGEALGMSILVTVGPVRVMIRLSKAMGYVSLCVT